VPRQWERAREEQERRELAGCTFAPRLTARAGAGGYTPLPQRLGELQRAKRCAPRGAARRPAGRDSACRCSLAAAPGWAAARRA